MWIDGWIQIIVDVLTSNALGCWLGMMTLDHLSMKKYNWAGVKRIHTVKGKVSRLIAQFSPYSWQQYEWDMFANVKNFLFCSFLVMMISFFLPFLILCVPIRMNTCVCSFAVPPGSSLNL
jgi:phosphatidylserine synthase 2